MKRKGFKKLTASRLSSCNVGPKIIYVKAIYSNSSKQKSSSKSLAPCWRLVTQVEFVEQLQQQLVVHQTKDFTKPCSNIAQKRNCATGIKPATSR